MSSFGGAARFVSVTIYTDPGCPFGFNAQRQELQLQWHYGHGLEITRRMIVLTEQSTPWGEGGLTREIVASNLQRLRGQYGMPMVTKPQPRRTSTLQGCHAYVGARIHDPKRADVLLRNLRCRTFSEGQAIDELQTIHGAAAEAGIPRETVEAWLADHEVEAALQEDIAAARAPLPEALALAHRLSKSDGGFRYSTASAVFETPERRVVMAGFQPFAVYEIAIANVAPGLERRVPAKSAQEILSWAPYPLATAEVAELRQISRDDARTELEQAGARFSSIVGDGYWSFA
jgi:predicted DsbA family dithiol-disulfide isomerase